MNINFTSFKRVLGKVFENPFEENSSLIRKVAFVAFHALTLGIPLTVFFIVDYRFPKVDEVVSNLKEIALNGLEQKRLSNPVNGKVEPYTYVEWEALQFADKKLEEHPEFYKKDFFQHLFLDEAEKFREHYEKGHPTNPKIAPLLGVFKMYEKALLKKFNALKDPWANEKFLEQYDAYIKVGFAISILTLEDLANLTEKMAAYRHYPNNAYVTLVRQDAYPFISFGFGIRAYMYAKDEMIWKTGPRDNTTPEKPLYQDSYYTPETIQNRWNKLHNDFCDRFRMYFPENKEYYQIENRTYDATHKDLKQGNV